MKNVSNESTVISIVHGTSFGHCRGYCIKELNYTAEASIYIEKSRDSINFPTKESTTDFTKVEFKELTELIDWNKWEALDSVIGCPDCADRGAEYLIITTKKGSKKVIYDAYSTPEGLGKLLTSIREKRRLIERVERNKGDE